MFSSKKRMNRLPSIAEQRDKMMKRRSSLGLSQLKLGRMTIRGAREASKSTKVTRLGSQHEMGELMEQNNSQSQGFDKRASFLTRRITSSTVPEDEE